MKPTCCRSWLLASCVLAVGVLVLWAGPWNQWTPAAVAEGQDVIVPLYARDPSALVMGPSAVQCHGPCPSIEKLK